MHPFSHTECICLGLTTQQHTAGIEVSRSDWINGGAQKTSYVSPWYVVTIKHRDFDRQQGELASDFVEGAVEDLHQYTAVS